MASASRTVLVAGVTGQQGGAVAAHLLASGWRVRGLTRNPAAAAARTLAATGVDIVDGDLEDPASLDEALRGAHAVFSVQPSALSADVPAGFGPADEVR